MATFDVLALFNAAQSHAQSLGLFESVNAHEPKNAPGSGLRAAVWTQSIGPVQASGLDQTSGRIELSVRIYSNMLAEPQDAIDPQLLAAVSTLMGAYSGDFDLGVTGVRFVDVLGAYGTPLSAQAGYLNQDGKLYRVITISVPVIINDIWAQSA